MAASKDSVPELIGSYALKFSGSRDNLLDWLEEACRRRSPLSVYMNVNPRFEPLHGHPRFRALLTKSGLDAGMPAGRF